MIQYKLLGMRPSILYRFKLVVVLLLSDYDLWPAAAQMMLFISSFFGGCSGSTTGGVKIIRLIILIKSSIIYPA